MLTKTDLQAIDKLFTKRLDDAIVHQIDPLITKRTDEIVTKRISQALKPVNRKLDLVISFFDREIVTLRKRVDRIEDHLHIPPLAS